jgi:hypothetical protein
LRQKDRCRQDPLPSPPIEQARRYTGDINWALDEHERRAGLVEALIKDDPKLLGKYLGDTKP